MAIKDHIHNSINAINSEKSRAIDVAKQKAMQDIIIPHNAEIDKQLNEAIAELTAEYNKDVAERKQKYEQDRQALIDMANHNKANFQNATINTVTTEVSMEYDQTLADLENVLKKHEE
jgi:hypothetical protein